MEFRKYVNEGVLSVHDNDLKAFVSQQGNSEVITGPESGCVPNKAGEVERRALFLPQRSLLILSGEARYAWHHYIPHHKVRVSIPEPQCI